MTDIEHIIDRRIERAAEYYKGSELCLNLKQAF